MYRLQVKVDDVLRATNLEGMLRKALNKIKNIKEEEAPPSSVSVLFSKKCMKAIAAHNNANDDGSGVYINI